MTATNESTNSTTGIETYNVYYFETIDWTMLMVKAFKSP